jgi:hypothetical protein
VAWLKINEEKIERCCEGFNHIVTLHPSGKWKQKRFPFLLGVSVKPRREEQLPRR